MQILTFNTMSLVDFYKRAGDATHDTFNPAAQETSIAEFLRAQCSIPWFSRRSRFEPARCFHVSNSTENIVRALIHSNKRSKGCLHDNVGSARCCEAIVAITYGSIRKLSSRLHSFMRTNAKRWQQNAKNVFPRRLCRVAPDMSK